MPREPMTKFLLNLPASHKERLIVLATGRYDSLNGYLRAIVKQEILRQDGVLPGAEKIARKRVTPTPPEPNTQVYPQNPNLISKL